MTNDKSLEQVIKTKADEHGDKYCMKRDEGWWARTSDFKAGAHAILEHLSQLTDKDFDEILAASIVDLVFANYDEEDKGAAISAIKSYAQQAHVRCAAKLSEHAEFSNKILANITKERDELQSRVAELEGVLKEADAALWHAEIRMGILVARMRGCHEETGNHELIDESQAYVDELKEAHASIRERLKK